MLRKTLTLAICFFFLQTVKAQKTIIDHTAYNDWKRITESVISPDGKYTAYVVNPYKGDGFMYLVNNITGAKDSIARGKSLQFSHDGSLLVFKIAPQAEALRKAELDQQKKDKWPKDSLGIWFVQKDSITRIPNVKEVQLAEKANVVAYLSHKNQSYSSGITTAQLKPYLAYYPQFESKASLQKTALRSYLMGTIYKRKGTTFKSDGTELTVLNFDADKKASFINVKSFDVNKTGTLVSFMEHRRITELDTKTKKSTELKDSMRLFVYQTGTHTTWLDKSSYMGLKSVAFSENQQSIACLATQDTLQERFWCLHQYDVQTGNRTVLIDGSRRFEYNRVLSAERTPKFINNDTDILFGVWDEADAPFKDSILESEKVKVDVWHWKDKRIQAEQLVDLKGDEAQNNLYVYHSKDSRFVQLGQDTLVLRLPRQDKMIRLLAFSDEPYRRENWASPERSDVYLIDPDNGEATLLLKNYYFDVNLSPSGKHFVYFEQADQNYKVRTLENNAVACATCGVKTNLLDDINGMPMIHSPLGIIGWTAGEEGVLTQAERDIIYYEFGKNTARSLTASLRANAADTNYNYSLMNLKGDSVLFYPENCVLTRFNKETKAMQVYRLSGSFSALTFELIEGSDHNYTGFKKARNSNALLFQRHSNADYPDLFVSNKVGETSRRLSWANPQQSNYNWSTVELIRWNSYSGIPLEGLLYKPENFDPNKSYPLLVYYYEMYADELHNHYAPRATASIIFPTEYASAGYVVLIPDIRYTPGHPANGAYDCIMSGTDAVLKQYPNVDSTRMGLQGQSWGGYQTAQLITMTTRYRAAMAGAPVSNMFSAYGGIRWGSGFSRQFQYEHTQSRIGKTIWEAPELYIENSPLFHLPKVSTPLLIMANDEDGAVPWYQGIELYMGLRRLSKPVWMLNYCGDDHNLMKLPNRMDLSIRMRQFFDYYLMNKTAPVWLEEGIPAIDKGIGIQYDITK